MAIEFRCTNPACGKTLTVSDKLAGRIGNCPECGEVVDVPDPAKAERVVRFGAIGLAWTLLTAKPGTWFLAAMLVAVCSALAQGVVGFVMVFAGSMMLAAQVAAAGGPPNLASPWFFLATLVPMVAAAAVQGVFLGGLYRTALRQLDGHSIRASDVFSVGGSAAGTAAATALLVLGAYAGLMAMIVPGLVFLGLASFVLPVVVDGPTGGLDAFRRSWGALKGEWLRATLFHGALGFVLISGVMLFGVGLAFTLPLYVLATAAQYRRSFAPGAELRPHPVENPYEDAVGVPRREQTPARVPVPVWFLLAAGMSSPVVVVGGLILLTASLFQSLNEQRPAAFRDRDRARAVARAQPVERTRAAVAETRPVDRAPGETPAITVTMIPAAPGAPLKYHADAEAVAALAGDAEAKKEAFRYLLSRPFDDTPRPADVARSLVPLLNDPETVEGAERALLRWATADDVPALLETLRSPADSTRRSTMRVLSRVGDERALAPLTAFLLEYHDREYAVRALTEFGARSEAAVTPFLTHPDPAVRSAAAAVLASTVGVSFSNQVTRGLTAMKSRDKEERIGGLSTLGTFASAAPARRPEVVAALEEALGDPESNIRGSATRLLGQLGGEDAVPVLIKVLDDPDRFVRRDALECLGRRKSPQTLALTADRLDDPDLREAAVQLLRVWGPEARPEAVKALQKTNPETRKAACEVLRRIGTREALDPLRLAANDPDAAVAATARAALAAVERRTRGGRKSPGTGR